MHRDVSVNNIMILEGVVVHKGAKCVVYKAALLCDWDLCKYKEQMGKGARIPVRFVRVSCDVLFQPNSFTLAGDSPIPLRVIPGLSDEAVSAF